MATVFKHLLAANTTGYVVSLGSNCSYLSLKADSGCDLYIKPQYAASAPSTPTDAFIAGSGAQVETIHLTAGQTMEIDLAKGRAGEHLQDGINYLQVWSATGGVLNVVGF